MGFYLRGVPPPGRKPPFLDPLFGGHFSGLFENPILHPPGDPPRTPPSGGVPPPTPRGGHFGPPPDPPGRGGVFGPPGRRGGSGGVPPPDTPLDREIVSRPPRPPVGREAGRPGVAVRERERSENYGSDRRPASAGERDARVPSRCPATRSRGMSAATTAIRCGWAANPAAPMSGSGELDFDQ